MYRNIRQGLTTLLTVYSLGCSSNPGSRTAEDANDEVQETVHVTHEEETVVTTRTEVVEEHREERRQGNATTVDQTTRTNSEERRIRTVERREGEQTNTTRNLTLNLEGLVSGIRNGRLMTLKENDDAYFRINFTYNGVNLIATLIDFSDEFAIGEGDHVCDYFLISIKRGSTSTYFMRINYSNTDSSMEFRQEPHTASIDRNVRVGNVVYRVEFEGGHDAYEMLSNADLMQLVDTARERLPSDYR